MSKIPFTRWEPDCPCYGGRELACPIHGPLSNESDTLEDRHRRIIPGMPTNPKDKIGAKKAPLHLVPAALTIGVAEVMADGAEKYGPYNWREESIGFNTYLAAIERHLLALRDGQDCSVDSGHHHLKAIGANVGILLDAMALGKLIDDRSVGPAAALLEELDKSADKPT